METRTIEQVKLHLLVLNHMTNRCEDVQVVAFSVDLNRLKAWYEEQKVDEPYCEQDGDRSWYRTFKQDSPLKWYNSMETHSAFDNAGYHEQWVNMDQLEEVKKDHRYIE